MNPYRDLGSFGWRHPRAPKLLDGTDLLRKVESVKRKDVRKRAFRCRRNLKWLNLMGSWSVGNVCDAYHVKVLGLINPESSKAQHKKQGECVPWSDLEPQITVKVHEDLTIESLNPRRGPVSLLDFPAHQRKRSLVDIIRRLFAFGFCRSGGGWKSHFTMTVLGHLPQQIEVHSRYLPHLLVCSRPNLEAAQLLGFLPLTTGRIRRNNGETQVLTHGFTRHTMTYLHHYVGDKACYRESVSYVSEFGVSIRDVGNAGSRLYSQ